jgi:2-polyprenyl-3-methyl-5-hydroxy-6-metoxy-1,4-benzoquinol methylase
VLNERRVQPEVMDDPALSAGAHRAALRGLTRINRISRAGAIIWSHVSDAIAATVAERGACRVLDVACGGGDVLLDVAERATQAGLQLQPIGCDLSERALGFAQERFAARNLAVEFLQRDVLADELPEADVVLNTLFLHHLTRAQGVTLVKRMTHAARERCLLADLERGWSGYVAAAVGSRVLSRSPVVHVDALLSVRAAYRRDELVALFEEAGCPAARVTRTWPFRLLAAWSPT